MRKGFTLIELILVVAILAILGSMAASRLRSFREEAEAGSCRANLRRISTAQRLYLTSSGGTEYAGSLGELEQYLEDAGSIWCPSGGEYILATSQVMVICSYTDPVLHGSVVNGICSWE